MLLFLISGWWSNEVQNVDSRLESCNECCEHGSIYTYTLCPMCYGYIGSPKAGVYICSHEGAKRPREGWYILPLLVTQCFHSNEGRAYMVYIHDVLIFCRDPLLHINARWILDNLALNLINNSSMVSYRRVQLARWAPGRKYVKFKTMFRNNLSSKLRVISQHCTLKMFSRPMPFCAEGAKRHWYG